MDAPENLSLGGRELARADNYEAPRVERVLTPAELEQEILYAGAPVSTEDDATSP